MRDFLKWEGAPRDIQDIGPRFNLRLKHILKIIRKEKPENMLEIGAGNGNMAEAYKRYVKNLLLTDVSPISIKLLKKRFRNDKNIRFKQVNILKNDLKEKFDFILLSEVLEHIKEDELFLKKIHSLLKENGKLLITVPANEKYRGEEDNRAGHIRRYSHKDIKKLLKICRFSIVKFIGWGYPIMTKYYRFYNQRYNNISKKKSRIKKIIIKSAIPFIFFIELVFKNQYDKSLGFIILAKRTN